MTEQNEIEHREHELKTFPRYRKKPVEIEAFQLGVHPYLPDWFMDKLSANDIVTHGRDYGPIEWAEIKTLEGIMRVERGDWIIKGVKGEIYPCKPDIFAMTYESAAQQADAWQPIVDVRLLNDAITLITKSLAAMLTDSSFASPYAEDHRPSTPRWVIRKFAHDCKRRTEYVNDIKQRLDWIRNATAKVRELPTPPQATRG